MLVLATKFFPVAIDDSILNRPRLLSLLGTPSTYRFIGLIAPAGYGKSTLARQWLDEQQVQPVWLSLDSGDNTPEGFWRYLLEAFSRNSVDVSDLLPYLPASNTGVERSPLSSQGVDVKVLASGLINHLVQRADTNFGLVLDDLHYVDHPEILTGLQYLIDFAPPNLVVIATSRREPALPIARWKVKRFARTLYSADLSFTQSEIHLLLGKSGSHVMPENVALEILQATGGWAAALQLLNLADMEGDQLREDRILAAIKASKRDIESYVAGEILDDIPSHLKEFVLDLAPALRFNARFADAVRGSANSAQMLHELNQRNLFLIALDDQGDYFRFHDLLREGALHYLHLHEPERLNIRIDRVVSHYSSTNQFVDAIELAVELRKWTKLADILEEYGATLLRKGYHLNILSALEQAPERLLEDSPELQLIQLWALFYNNQFSELPVRLEKLRDRLKHDDADSDLSGTLPELFLQADLLESYLARFRHDTAEAKQLTQKVLHHLNQLKAPLKSLAYFGLANDEYSAGNFPAAESALKDSITHGKLEQRFSTVKSSLGLLLWILQIRGEYIRALNLYRDTESWLSSYHKDDPEPDTVSCWLNSALVLIHLGRNEPLPALRYLEPMRALVEDAEPLQKYLVKYVEGRYQAFSGNHEAAIRAFDESQLLSEQYHEALSGYPLPTEAAKYLLALNQNLAQIPGLNVDTQRYEFPYLRLAYLQVDAWRLCSEGPEEMAEQRIENLIQSAVSYQAPRYIIRGKLYLATVRTMSANGALAPSSDIAVRTADAIYPLLLDSCQLAEKNDIVEPFYENFPGPEGPHQAALQLIGQYRQQLLVDGIAQPFLDKLQKPGMDEISIAAQNEANSALPGERKKAGPSTDTEVSVEELSRRELEVLNLIEEGFPNKRIATQLNLAPATVKAHIRNIYAKLGATSRTEALAIARRTGIFSPD